MKLRQIIITAIGLLIIAGGYLGMNKMGSREKPEHPKEERILPTVFTQVVKNGSSPVQVTASGNLMALDRIEIFSEVQGIFEHSARPFKPGIKYTQGEVLMQLNSDEHKANVQAQKSALYNQLVAILPDLKFDYPGAFDKWKSYISAFDINRKLTTLPTASTEQEKLFIASKNISSTWHNVHNLEERQRKFTIYAPYDGVLTEANIDKGALVRPGQKLGEFINPYVYEIGVAVNSSNADQLKVGNSVSLHNVERTKVWKGKISRLNSLIDPNTQTVQAFIRVSGKGLREGMYLEADLKAKNESNTFEIARTLMVDNSKVYVMNNDTLKLQVVEPVHFTEKTTIVRGLPDGTEILDRVLPGAYDGMVVKRFSE